MASVGGVSGSNTISSLMNSANMVSGLASGLDTEGMIESLVKGYQTKINQLSQKITKTEWKQDAYRSIIQKMVGFSNKYTSYSSSTNLMSPSFFTGAVKVLTKGEFADSVTASGKTSSDISLDAVHQLAKAAQYRTKSGLDTGDVRTITAGENFDLFKEDQMEMSNLSGSLTLTYGSKTVDLSFSETADVEAMNEIRAKMEKEGKSYTDSDVLAELINQKLADQNIVFNSGSSESADKRIKAVSNGGSITFQEVGGGQNGVYISDTGGNIASQLGLDEEDLKNAAEKKPVTLNLNSIMDKDGGSKLTRKLSAIDRLAEMSNRAGGRTINMSLDGSTKQISAPHVAVEHNYDGDKYYINGEEIKAVEADPDQGIEAKSAKEVFVEKYTEALSTEVKKAFRDKVTVENTGTGEELKLEFRVKNEGSSLVINSSIGDAIGIGNTATSYLNTSKTLKDLLGDKLKDLTIAKDENGGAALTDKGKVQYNFVLNGVKIGTYSEDTQLSTILSDINSNKEAGVQAAYSQSTQNFTFTARETGEDSRIEMGEGLAQAMFGKVENSGSSTYTRGQDAIFTATINGEQKYMTRTSNSVNIDGMTINMTETFNSKVDGNGDPVQGADGKFEIDNPKKSVTFQSKTDSDKIVDAIKSMVADYNTMMSEIKSAYSTLPYQKSGGTFANYEPLTDEEREGMSESAIERYEEKAKQGILFGDRNLSGLYTKMNQAFSFTSRGDIDTLKDMGISIGFSISDGTQAIQLDEDKLRSMLDSDPDRVADLFTKKDGIMDRMKTQLDSYAKTTGEPKGILIQQAGSPLSSLSLMSNTWQKEIDRYTSQIETWQDKLSDQVDRYTQQFSRLEQLINQMNSQSSTLSGLMGG